jgi:AcrR family transcriptional regulator
MYDESTRDRLVAGAVTCVRSKGLAGATSRAITTTAGANLGAITYYFGSKDELLAEALLGVVNAQLDPVLHILSGDEGDARSRMLAAVAALLAGFKAVRSDAHVYLEALVNASRFPALSKGLVELLAQLRRFLAEQIAEQQAAGQLPLSIDHVATAGLLIAVAHGLVLSAVVDPAGADPAAMAAQFANLLLAVTPWPT